MSQLFPTPKTFLNASEISSEILSELSQSPMTGTGIIWTNLTVWISSLLQTQYFVLFWFLV